MNTIAASHDMRDTLTRLVQATCTLKVTADRHHEIVVDADEWEVNEAMHGVVAMLQGCADTLRARIDATTHEKPVPEVGDLVEGDEAALLRAWRQLTPEQRAEALERMRREAFQ